MVVDLAGWPHFFIAAIMHLIVSLAIGGAISMEANVIVGFSGLSLW